MSPLFLSPFLDFYVSDSTLIGKPANLWVSKLGNYPNRARKCPIILPLPNPPPRCRRAHASIHNEPRVGWVDQP